MPSTKRSNQWSQHRSPPFTRAQRAHTTLLFGGLTPAHEQLIQGGLSALGYRTDIIPTPTQADFHTGKTLCSYGMCNPAYFTSGALINYLQALQRGGLSKEKILQRYVYLTATSPCGPCRFGLYHQELATALKNSGFEGFRVLTIEQKPSLLGDARLGLDVNADFSLTVIYAVLTADLLNQLAASIRPFEIKPGETQRVLTNSISRMAATLAAMEFSSPHPSFRLRGSRYSFNHLSTPALLSRWYTFFMGRHRRQLLHSLHQVGRCFNAIEIDPLRIKPVVKITGEFWAQTTQGDGNYQLFPFLESEGAVLHIEPVATWLNYLIHVQRLYNKDQTRLIDKDLSAITCLDKLNAWLHYGKKQLALEVIQYHYQTLYDAMRRALGVYTAPLTNQHQLEALAHGYYPSRAQGGEGHMEVAKNIYCHVNHLAHMTLSLKPFGCMPSTQSDAVQVAVQAKHRDMIFLAVETGGEAKTNALSRVQMALYDAKTKAQLEWRQALQQCELRSDSVQHAIQQYPQLRRPAACLNLHHGAAGLAANLVYEVKQRLSAA